MERVRAKEEEEEAVAATGQDKTRQTQVKRHAIGEEYSGVHTCEVESFNIVGVAHNEQFPFKVTVTQIPDSQQNRGHSADSRSDCAIRVSEFQ